MLLLTLASLYLPAPSALPMPLPEKPPKSPTLRILSSQPSFYEDTWRRMFNLISIIHWKDLEYLYRIKNTNNIF